MYNKENPFLATIIQRKALTPPEASKCVYHLELSLAGSGLTYEPGDCVGVFAKNDPDLTKSILLQWKDLPKEITHPKTQALLTPEALLTEHFSLHHLSRELLQTFRDHADTKDKAFLNEVLSAPSLLTYTETRDLLDLLQDCPSARPPLEVILPHLRRLVPRLYSIASAQEAVGEQLDLTIKVSEDIFKERLRKGVASSFLWERAPLHTPSIPIFLTRSLFKLPQDPATPVILIGPGTGIAPYRGFIQANQRLPKPRKTWIFFGEQHKEHFFYKEEWDLALQNGALTRIDCAFSRDQPHKIYVQDRLWENRKELLQWLDEGASLYLCGDAHSMAPAAEGTIIRILMEEKGLDENAAQAWLKNMKKTKRYLKDVY
jgi:sulfite reductase (NADPH) flavoprotein alpha-component